MQASQFHSQRECWITLCSSCHFRKHPAPVLFLFSFLFLSWFWTLPNRAQPLRTITCYGSSTISPEMPLLETPRKKLERREWGREKRSGLHEGKGSTKSRKKGKKARERWKGEMKKERRKKKARKRERGNKPFNGVDCQSSSPANYSISCSPISIWIIRLNLIQHKSWKIIP